MKKINKIEANDELLRFFFIQITTDGGNNLDFDKNEIEVLIKCKKFKTIKPYELFNKLLIVSRMFNQEYTFLPKEFYFLASDEEKLGDIMKQDNFKLYTSLTHIEKTSLYEGIVDNLSTDILDNKGKCLEFFVPNLYDRGHIIIEGINKNYIKVIDYDDNNGSWVEFYLFRNQTLTNKDILKNKPKDTSLSKSITLDILKKYPDQFKYLDEKFKTDRNFILKFIKKDASILQYLNEELKSDKEIVLNAVKNHGDALEFASKELKADIDIVLKAVRSSGNALRFTNDIFKSDKNIVLEAVKSYGKAIEFANDTLKSDRDIILEAVKNSGNALKFASRKLKGDRKIVEEAVKNYGMALGYASEKLKDDKDIVTKAIKSNYNSVQFASVKLLRDREIASLTNSLREKDGKKLDFKTIINILKKEKNKNSETL